jgi:hypothetical protein
MISAVTVQTLPDGTNYAAETVLSIPGDDIEVRIENSNYKKGPVVRSVVKQGAVQRFRAAGLAASLSASAPSHSR